MSKFFQKIADFMQNRYGNDKLNIFLLMIAIILYIINIFARSSILIVIIMLLVLLVILRALSKNITKRLYENRRFTDIFGSVGDFIKRQYMRLRDIKTHRYVRCPFCKAQLRLKKRTGVQQIHCPRCGEDFKKNILF